MVAWSALVGHAGDAVALQIVKPPTGFHLRKKNNRRFFEAQSSRGIQTYDARISRTNAQQVKHYTFALNLLLVPGCVEIGWGSHKECFFVLGNVICFRTNTISKHSRLKKIKGICRNCLFSDNFACKIACCRSFCLYRGLLAVNYFLALACFNGIR